MQTDEIPVPENWTATVRRGMLHAVSLAHFAMAYTRSMAANSPIERVRLKGKLDRAENEIALLREQLDLIKGRFKRIPAKHRPHETLGARTPQEVCCNSPPLPKLSFSPKSKTPEFDMDCRYFEGRKHLLVISRRTA